MPFSPTLFLIPKEGELEYCGKSALSHPKVKEITAVKKKATIYSEEKEQVIKGKLHSRQDLENTINDLKSISYVKEVTDTVYPQYLNYLLDKNLAPLNKIRAIYNSKRNKIKEIKPLEQDYQQLLNNLKIASIDFRLEKGRLKEVYLYEEETDQFYNYNRNQLIKLERRIRSYNPEVIVSHHGDRKLKVLKQEKPDLKLGKSGSGKIKFKSEAKIPGRIHLDLLKDLRNDIYVPDLKDYSIESISSSILNKRPKNLEERLEVLAKLGKKRIIPLAQISQLSFLTPDKVFRISPGRINTFLHYKVAKRRDYLISSKKKNIEMPKTLRELYKMDRGGTIFYPEPGIYNNVANCDFSSLYPSLIVKNNISSETINCDCCSDPIEVPGASWTFCKEKKGIIPEGIEQVLQERNSIKKKIKELKYKRKRKNDNKLEEKVKTLDLRQRALKTILVTCFGYLGFSNFNFSRIEGKESVMAFGREILKRGKSIAEKTGLKLVYGVVDSLFVTGGDLKSYKRFCQTVTEETEVELELDDLFTKIVFLPEKGSSKKGLANKYFGKTNEGKIKGRGLYFRKRDTPKLIKEYQRKAIELFLESEEPKSVINKLEGYLDCLKSKDYELSSLTILKKLRKSLGNYKQNSPHVKAAKRSRKSYNKGDFVKFFHSEEGPTTIEEKQGKNISYPKYKELFIKATTEVLSVLGYNEKEIEKHLKSKYRQRVKTKDQKKIIRYL